MLNEKRSARLEIAFRASQERKVELGAEVESLQEAIEGGSKEVKELQGRVTKLKQEKDLEASTVTNLSTQAKDWKEKCKDKEKEHEKMSDEHHQMKHNKDLNNFMQPFAKSLEEQT